VFYISDYGQEIKPDPNAEMLQHLAHNDMLVYSCGSLWTSIVPCLALKGVASAIAKSKTLKAKVLLRECFSDQVGRRMFSERSSSSVFTHSQLKKRSRNRWLYCYRLCGYDRPHTEWSQPGQEDFERNLYLGRNDLWQNEARIRASETGQPCRLPGERESPCRGGSTESE
jgi:hypothetical protein